MPLSKRVQSHSRQLQWRHERFVQRARKAGRKEWEQPVTLLIIALVCACAIQRLSGISPISIFSLSGRLLSLSGKPPIV